MNYSPVQFASNDRLLKDFVDLYFRQAFEAFCGSQKQVDQMLRQAHNLTSKLPAVATFLPPWMSLSTPLQSAQAPASESNEEPGSAAVKNEVAALREEISKLKAQIKVRSSSPPKRQKEVTPCPFPDPLHIGPYKEMWMPPPCPSG